MQKTAAATPAAAAPSSSLRRRFLISFSVIFLHPLHTTQFCPKKQFPGIILPCKIGLDNTIVEIV
jgi:hypothetical protein